MTTLTSRTKARHKSASAGPQIALSRRLAAEALGTGFLVAVIVGSGIMAAALSPDNGGVALLANAAATGMILIVLITCLGPVSGAHFNPAVSFAFWLRGEIDGRSALFYGAVQITAGIVGTLAAHLMFGLDLVQAGSQARTGIGIWFGEAVATFALVFTILASLAVRPQFVATGVGLVVMTGIWATSSTCFANPAVTIARAFTDSYTAIRPLDALVFLPIEFFAAAVASGIAGWLFANIKPRVF